MATYKCSFLVNYQSNFGKRSRTTRTGSYSETLYRESSNVNDLIEDCQIWAQKRAGLLVQGSEVVGVRISDVLVRTQRQIGLALPGSPTFPADTPQTCLYVNFPAVGSVNARNFCFHSIPDAVCIDGEYVPDGSWSTRLTRMLRWFEGWRFRAIQQTAFVEIDDINDAGLVTTVDEHGLSGTGKVQIQGTKDVFSESHNGVFTFLSTPTAKTLQLRGWGDNGETTGGQLRQYDIFYPLLDWQNCAIGKVGKRNIGRPIGGYVGRRSAKK